MAIKLLVPRPRLIVPKLPSYVKLDMAFGVGVGSTLFDKSRYRSHGTITGAAWSAGLHGYALDFIPGTPSYVEIPASYTQLNFTSEDFSLVMRVYVDDLTVSRYLFCRGLRNNSGYEFYVSSAGGLVLWMSQAGASQHSRSALGGIAAGSWVTMGLSRKGASVVLYVNGVVSSSVVGIHINPATCARTALIGIHSDKVTNPLDGKVEFLRVFGGVSLLASEHLAWHNALA